MIINPLPSLLASQVAILGSLNNKGMIIWMKTRNVNPSSLMIWGIRLLVCTYQNLETEALIHGGQHAVYQPGKSQLYYGLLKTKKMRKTLGAKVITWFAWNISNASQFPNLGNCYHYLKNNSIYSEAPFFELITDYLVLFARVGEGSAGLVALCGSLLDQFLADWKSNTKASSSCVLQLQTVTTS